MIKISLLRRLLPYIPDISNPWLRRKLVELFPHEGVQHLKAIVDVMHRRSIEIYKEKIRALEKGDEAVKQNIGEGRDLISILSEYAS